MVGEESGRQLIRLNLELFCLFFLLRSFFSFSRIWRQRPSLAIQRYFITDTIKSANRLFIYLFFIFSLNYQHPLFVPALITKDH